MGPNSVCEHKNLYVSLDFLPSFIPDREVNDRELANSGS